MIIVEKNEGEKIPYVVEGTKLTLNDMLTIDLRKYQRDEERIIDISLDENDILQMGLGRWYIANIIIPPKTYKMVDTGTKDDKENEIYERVAEPLNMDEVTLILWALPYNYSNLTGGAF